MTQSQAKSAQQKQVKERNILTSAYMHVSFFDNSSVQLREKDLRSSKLAGP